MPFTAQSNVENIPPHTPKFPPSTGARAFIAVNARRSISLIFLQKANHGYSPPILRSPYGLFLYPLIPCHTKSTQLEISHN